jgi:hypothetical protein
VSVDAETAGEDTRTLPGVGVQMTAACGITGEDNPATFEISGGDFSVSGSYETTNTNSLTLSSGSVQAINDGTYVRNDIDQSGTDGFQINTSTTGQVSAHLVITVGGAVASVEVFLAGSTTTFCAVHAVGVPTS